MSTRRIAACLAAVFLSMVAITTRAAPASGCAAKPAPTQMDLLHGIKPPPYLSFVTSAENVRAAEYFAWDQQQFPAWGGTGGPEEMKRGKHWHFLGALADGCGDKDQAWAALAPAFQKAGWKVIKVFEGQPLLILLRYTQGGTDAWANVTIDQPPDVDMHVVEVGPLPIHLTLAAPAATPETVIPESGDFPYISPIPGSHFKSGAHDDSELYFTQPDPQPEELVASGSIVKGYDPPDGTSALEFVAIYHEAFTKAGWTIVDEKPEELIEAHYGKAGRNLWAYLHIDADGYNIRVGDEGSLATQLSKDCHVALTGLTFDFDKATLKPDSAGTLQQVLALMTRQPALKLQVQGHTDNVGDDAYNQKLSEQRAAAVVTWLTQHGVAAARLSSAGYGRTRPVADNGTDEGRAKNRRVEIVDPACKARGG